MEEREGLEHRKAQAITSATKCIKGYLEAESWDDARPYVVGHPQPVLGADVGLSAVGPTDIKFQTVERRPGTEEFIVKHWVQPANGSPAVLWTEEHEDGRRLRVDFLEQQLSGKIPEIR